MSRKFPNVTTKKTKNKKRVCTYVAFLLQMEAHYFYENTNTNKNNVCENVMKKFVTKKHINTQAQQFSKNTKNTL